MIRIPALRDKPRSGILRGPRRDWPRHRAFIRRHACVATLGKVIDDCEGAIQACHYRTAANSGKSLKSADWDTFPACVKHHAEQHRIGQPAFERKYGIDLAAICAEMARLSTDMVMRETMREMGL